MPPRFIDKSCFAALLASFFAGLYISNFYTLNNLTLLRPEGIVVLYSLMILPLLLVTFLIYSVFYLVGKREKAPIVLVFINSAFLLVMLNPALLGINLIWRYFDAFREHYIFANVAFVSIVATLVTFIFHKKLEIYGLFLGFLSIAAIVLGFHSIAMEPSPLAKKGRLGSYLQKVQLRQKPNIYFILLDGFGSLTYMKELGIDVSDFSERLSEQGFRLYEDAYSNYQTTTSSMPSILDMAHHYYMLNEGRVHFTEVSKASRRVIAGDNNVSHILRNNGYSIQYIHNGSYLLLQGCSADTCFPEADKLVGVKIILSNVFKRDLLSDADKVSRFSTVDAIRAEIERLMDTDGSGPRFQYIHVYAPNHTPKERSGSCDEDYELNDYGKRVGNTSTFALDRVGYILSRDPGAVIVLAGDHGPYILNKCDSLAKIGTVKEYRDRAGILLAIRWPASYRGEYDDRIVTAVNVFRFILASLADEKAPLLDTIAEDDVFVLQRNGQAFRIIQDGVPLTEPQRIKVLLNHK